MRKLMTHGLVTLVKRSVVIAATAAGLVIPATAAGASQTPALGWSPTTMPGTYNYGTLAAGQTVSKTFTLTNSGSSGTSALKVTLTGSAAFTKTADTCSGTSLGPKKKCGVTIAFAPATPGENDQATLTGISNKPFATASLTLLGAAAKAGPALATSPSGGGTVGSTTVTDEATLTGGYKPTGTVTFSLYPTPDCSGPPVDTETVTVSGNGNYTTPTGDAPTAAGTYQWTVSYTGDAANNSVSSACGQEAVTISPAAPTIATSPSGGGTVGSTTVTDEATLTGGYKPTGTVTFSLYPTPDCSGPPVDTETVTVSGNGTYTTPTGYTPGKAGTYQWMASYSGDVNNSEAASACGDENVGISPASPSMTTSSPTPELLGSTVTDTANLAGGYHPTGTITFSLYPTQGCSGPPVDTETVTVSGNGSYGTPTGYAPASAGTYQWTASYSGDTNNNSTLTPCGSEPVTLTTCLVSNTSSGQGYTALQDAVGAAAGGDTLTVEGTCTGRTTVGKNLTITGQPASGYPTPTLNGSQAGTVVAVSQGATVTINTLTITGGHTGGCCGGGISNSGTLILNNAVVTGNTSINGAGGGGIGNFGSLILNSSTVSDNSAAGGGGGGIWSNGTVILNGSSSVTGNASFQGGGIGAFGGTVTLNDNTSISGNSVGPDGAVGGGIAAFNTTVTMAGSATITTNTSSNVGGGIFHQGGTLNGAVAGPGGNVFNNTPDDIFP